MARKVAIHKCFLPMSLCLYNTTFYYRTLKYIIYQVCCMQLTILKFEYWCLNYVDGGVSQGDSPNRCGVLFSLILANILSGFNKMAMPFVE